MDETREIICNAFQKLAEKKNPDKITVVDICEQANISRKTFYYYFVDKFDLFKYIYKDNLVKRMQSHIKKESWKDVIEHSINDAIDSREFFDKILGESSVEFTQIIFEIQYEVYCQELSKYQPDGKLPMQIEAEIYIFLKGGTEYLKHYFQTYKDPSYKNVSKLIVGAMPESLSKLWESKSNP